MRGVRLACVRPAASVRSEPGSNSQVESSILVGLEVNPRNLCVTGTFTQSATAQAALMLPWGLPGRGAYGDGLKRRDRQSSCFDPSSACAPVGSARTPPPAFPFLLCTCQRARHGGQRPARGQGRLSPFPFLLSLRRRARGADVPLHRTSDSPCWSERWRNSGESEGRLSHKA